MAPSPRSQTFWVETLGCPKNAVDSDKVTASLIADGLEAAPGAGDADVVVVNTCAFVEAARQESIDTILSLADARRPGARIVVTGCLAERSGDELAAAMPEIDAVVGFADEGAIASVAVDAPTRRGAAAPSGGARQGASDREAGVPPRSERPREAGVRDLLELPRAAPSARWAYLKVAEGCDRACAFCAIPSFRGSQRSRTPEAILAEAAQLVDGGVAELVLVAQDLAWYGRDAGETGALTPLLRRLDADLGPSGLRRVRLLYLYPSEVRDPLVSTMLELDTVVPYFDLSLQHADRALLARMKRWGSGERFLELVDGIRAQEPAAAFRSSFIVGFPGETEAAHDALLAFLADARLDWAGFFPFSSEDGTPAATMDAGVPVELVHEWLRECEEAQTPITQASRDALVRAGAEVEVLVDGVDDETGEATGRTHREAPEIDGIVRLRGVEAEPAEPTGGAGVVRLRRTIPNEAEPAEPTGGGGVVGLRRTIPKEAEGVRGGTWVRAKVTDAIGPDLVADPIEVLA